MLKKYRVADSCCSGFGDVKFEASVVLHQCAQVISGFGVGVPRLSVCGLDVYLGCTSNRREWLLRVIVLAVHVGEHQYFWYDVGLPEEVHGEFCLLEEGTPQ